MRIPTKRDIDKAAQRMHDAQMRYGNHDAVTARAEIAYYELKNLREKILAEKQGK